MRALFGLPSRLVCCFFALAVARCNWAYPPAPYHLVYGLVRDELGNPVTSITAEVILESSSGVKITTLVAPTKEPGANYHIGVPLDAGITTDLYKPTALRPAVPFKMRVRIGQKTYLPIEMTGDYSALGRPGEKTRINLTLGEDSDGDGIPDAWERMFSSVAEINPNDDFDRDGLSNLEEYIAGTYAFDPADGFTLKIVRTETAGSIVEFLALRGRTYTILASADLKEWTAVSFQIVANNVTGNPLQHYYSSDTRNVQVQAVLPPELPAATFFRLIVQ
jgi:hypothetical protein